MIKQIRPNHYNLVHSSFQCPRSDFIFLATKQTTLLIINLKYNQSKAYITCTMAPHPLSASLSTAFSKACDTVSNRSSGSYIIMIVIVKHCFYVDG